MAGTDMAEAAPKGESAPPQGSVTPAAPSLNVYKKISVIRRSDDTLKYEDAEGTLKTVSIQELGDAISTATPLVTAKPKIDIPVPRINSVATYTRDVSDAFGVPQSYVRYQKPSQEELKKTVEYVADEEDENWLNQNAKFGGGQSKMGAVEPPPPVVAGQLTRRPQLKIEQLEHMMDLLEKATAFETIITFHQAEALILSKLPQLYHTFPSKPRQGTTLKQVLNDMYTYWVNKRSKLKRPLLRRFWPVTSTDDTNPHLVFRPREKEKYKLRKKRQNDKDAYLKLKQLRNDFDTLRTVLELVKAREELNRTKMQLQLDLFHQRLFDVVDTSGRQRLSTNSKEDLKRIMDVPIQFDPTTGRRIKRIRAVEAPVPGSAFGATTVVGTGDTSKRRVQVAGRNFGEPAPLFVHPLSTRETYVSSWENAVPHFPTYVNAHAEPTLRFRHRPRVGRGGRICIDRLPQPTPDEGPSPPTVFIAGRPLPQSTYTRPTLLDWLPRPFDTVAASRKIEQLSILAAKEDLMAATTDAEENDGDEVIVKMDHWLDTDDPLWGDERFAIGPI